MDVKPEWHIEKGEGIMLGGYLVRCKGINASYGK
jgi:hypothetical protein